MPLIVELSDNSSDESDGVASARPKKQNQVPSVSAAPKDASISASVASVPSAFVPITKEDAECTTEEQSRSNTSSNTTSAENISESGVVAEEKPTEPVENAVSSSKTESNEDDIFGQVEPTDDPGADFFHEDDLSDSEAPANIEPTNPPPPTPQKVSSSSAALNFDFEEKNDTEKVRESAKQIDMSKLESLFPGWKIPSDPKSVAERRKEDYKAAHKGKSTSQFIEEMNERAKVNKDNLPASEQKVLAALVAEHNKSEVLGEVTNKIEPEQTNKTFSKSDVIQPPADTTQGEAVNEKAASTNNENEKSSETSDATKLAEWKAEIAKKKLQEIEAHKKMEEEEKKKKNYPVMTKKALREICKKHKQYTTPHLNDILYLHYKGWWKIENLEEYTGLRCLWLDVNGLRKIENLDNLVQLRCLYLQQNLIDKIENLDALQDLRTLNLANNQLNKIENLSCLPLLETLHLAHNNLSTYEALEHLQDCHSVSCLDLSHNRIDDPSIIDIFEKMPNLKVVNLMGNPMLKKVRFYRKNMTIRLKNLTYLDDRPVFPRDRACAEAWGKGGHEAEKEERLRWATKEREKIQASVDYLRHLREEGEAKRAAKKQEDEKTESKIIQVSAFDELTPGQRKDLEEKLRMNNEDIPEKHSSSSKITEVSESNSSHGEEASTSDVKINEQVEVSGDQKDAHDDEEVYTPKPIIIPDSGDSFKMKIELAPGSGDADDASKSPDANQMTTFDLDDLPDLEDVDLDEELNLSEEKEIVFSSNIDNMEGNAFEKETPVRPKIEIISEHYVDDELNSLD